MKAPGPRWRRVGLVLAALVLLAAVLALLARDLPRRWVERRIAVMLEATVRLDRLEIVSLRHFVLDGLEIRDLAWESRVERAWIERLEVQAPIREALAGHYERLRAAGAELRLVPATRVGSAAPGAGVRIAQLEVANGRLVVGARDGPIHAHFSATLAGWGLAPTGQLSLDVERLELAPWLGLPGSVAALRAEVRLRGAGEPVALSATAERVHLGFDGSIWELRRPGVDATLTRSTGALNLSLTPRVPGVVSATVEAVIDPETYALRSGHAMFGGVDVSRVLGPVEVDGLRLDGAADVAIRTEDGEAFDYRVDGTLTRVELARPESTLVAEGVHAVARGRWRGRYEIEATATELGLNTGSFHLASTGPRLDGGGIQKPSGSAIEARVHLPGANAAAELFPIDVSVEGDLAWDDPPVFDGRLELHSPTVGALGSRGRFVWDRQVPSAKGRWEWSDAPGLHALVPTLRTLAGLDATVAWPALEIEGRPSALGTFEGPLDDPRLQGRLVLAHLVASHAPTPTVRAEATIDFSRRPGDGGRLEVDRLRLEGHLSHDVGEGWSSPLVATARGRLDTVGGALELREARIDLERFGRLHAEGRVEADRALSLKTRTEPIELSRIRELAIPWIGNVGAEFAVRGVATSRLDIERDPHGAWRARGELDLADLGFGSRDGSRVVEGAAGAWQLAMSGRPDGSVEVEANAELSGPIVLWGTLFGDYSQFDTSIAGSARRASGRWEARGQWDLPEGVGVGIEVGQRLGSPGIDYGFVLEVPDLAAFLRRYVQGPFEGSVDRIDALAAAGRLHVGLSGAADGTARSVEGLVTAATAAFSSGDGRTRITGLNLDLPVALRWESGSEGAYELVAGAERAGRLAYEALRLRGVELPPLDTPMIVDSDTVRLDRPLGLDLLGGRVELRDVALTHLARPQRELRFGLRLDGLSLSALTRELGPFPLEGALGGNFPAVRLTPERLEVDGGGTLQLFGGEVEVYDISGQDLSSRFPKLGFSARFEGLRLLELTRTFDFGEVRGVVQGGIRNCELFAGVPVRCEASLRSVKTQGVPRKISVKAIRNISILGAGPRVGILDRGLQKFLDTYNYSSIGLTMTLDRDRFLLRGTERRGDRELFVKGRLPFRIDIVNAAPGHTVSFQTMMRRLRNLQVMEPH